MSTVGALEVELFISDAHSLKDRRSVVRSLVQRTRNRYNVSVAEVGGQGTWQKAVLGVACVGGSASQVTTILNRVIAMIESDPRVVVVSADVEVF